MGIMRNFNRVWISLLLLVVSSAVNIKVDLITAADDNNALVPLLDVSQHLPRNLKWSTDSQNLIFQDIMDPQNLLWYRYEVTSDTLTQSDSEPEVTLTHVCAGLDKASYDRLSAS